MGNEGVYNKTIQCPVCCKNFDITKVKSKALKVASRDTDFCIYYEGVNPIYYDVYVCEHCGYAAMSEKFETIRINDAKTILAKLTPRWRQRSYAGERSVDLAIEAFKLALLTAQTRSGKYSELAKICIRLAWLYRIKKDEKEKEFMQYALRNYTEAYEKENLAESKMDEFTCMYMIAELHRRLENNEDAIKWFSRLISSPDARRNASLMQKARDQYQLVKEQQQ